MAKIINWVLGIFLILLGVSYWIGFIPYINIIQLYLPVFVLIAGVFIYIVAPKKVIIKRGGERISKRKFLFKLMAVVTLFIGVAQLFAFFGINILFAFDTYFLIVYPFVLILFGLALILMTRHSGQSSVEADDTPSTYQYRR